MKAWLIACAGLAVLMVAGGIAIASEAVRLRRLRRRIDAVEAKYLGADDG